MHDSNTVYDVKRALLVTRHKDWPDLYEAELEELNEEAHAVIDAIEPLIRADECARIVAALVEGDDKGFMALFVARRLSEVSDG